MVHREILHNRFMENSLSMSSSTRITVFASFISNFFTCTYTRKLFQRKYHLKIIALLSESILTIYIAINI